MKYSVLLHGKGLLLDRPAGGIGEGGVYTWRAVKAASAKEAFALARERLLADEGLAGAIWNEPDAPIEIDVEEFVSLDPDQELSDSDSGLVFYVED